MPTKGQREEAAEEENRLFIEIGKRIRDAREQAGLTSEQLADKLEISQSNISRWENAKYKITLPTLVKIANALDVSLDELIVGAARKIEKKTVYTPRYLQVPVSDASNGYGGYILIGRCREPHQ